MDISKFCPSPHITSDELQGDTVVTITGADFEDVGAEKVKKGVLTLAEFDRGFVCNKTNTKRIASLYGRETDDWVGKQITLYPSEADYNGDTVPCIRVRGK